MWSYICYLQMTLQTFSGLQVQVAEKVERLHFYDTKHH